MKEKTIQDYYELLLAEFPTVSLSDIKKICNYGWKSLYLANSYGGDVVLQRKKFWFYCGFLMKDSLKFCNYYRKKMKVKLRVLYKKRKISWDGYYYFGLSSELYSLYLSQKNSKGRPRKHFVFHKIKMYKLLDECKVTLGNAVAIFRMPFLIEDSWTKYFEELKTDKAEFLEELTPLKMNDIILSNYKYYFNQK